LALLRASGEHDGRTFSLQGVLDGTIETGVPHAALLLRFVDAVMGDDAALLRERRSEVQAVLGEAGVLDAAAVIGGFDGITRIADATGIPLEPAKVAGTADFFMALELGRYRAAKV
jgi:hypothetical protein